MNRARMKERQRLMNAGHPECGSVFDWTTDYWINHAFLTRFITLRARRWWFQCSNTFNWIFSPGSEGGLCPPSHYCPQASARPVPCPAGTYSKLTGQPVCSRCPAGYYCPEKTGNFTKFPCPPGFYCPDGIVTQNTTKYVFFFCF